MELFNHLVCECEQCGRHVQAERLRSLQIEREVELRWRVRRPNDSNTVRLEIAALRDFGPLPPLAYFRVGSKCENLAMSTCRPV